MGIRITISEQNAEEIKKNLISDLKKNVLETEEEWKDYDGKSDN